MDLTKFKDSIGKNLFALSGWIGLLIPILFFLIDPLKNGVDGNVMGIIIIPTYIFGILGLFGISLIVYVIELIFGYKIKNKFFLKNKVYNLCWLLGILFSFLFILILIFGILYTIYIIITTK